MKIVSVVCPRGGIGQTDCAYNIAKSFKNESKVLLIDCCDEISPKGRYFFENKDKISELTMNSKFLSQKDEKFSESNLDFIRWNKLDIKALSSSEKLESKYDMVIINCALIANTEEFEKVLMSSDEIIIPVSLDFIWKASLGLDPFLNEYKHAIPKKTLVPVINITKLNTSENSEEKVNKLKKDILSYAKEHKYEVLEEIQVLDDLDFYQQM